MHFLTQGHEEYAGKTFQLTGPAEYNYKELAEYVSDVTTQKTQLVDVPPVLASKLGRVVEEMVSPVLTADMVSSSHHLTCMWTLWVLHRAVSADPCFSVFALVCLFYYIAGGSDAGECASQGGRGLPDPAGSGLAGHRHGQGGLRVPAQVPQGWTLHAHPGLPLEPLLAEALSVVCSLLFLAGVYVA